MTSYQPFSDRINKVFTQLQHISETADAHKQSKWRIANQILNQVEKKIYDIQSQKEQKFEFLVKKVSILMEHLENQRVVFDKLDQEFNSEILKTQKQCLAQLDKFRKEREESEKRVVQKLANQIDALTSEIQKDQMTKSQDLNFYQNCLDNEIPQLQEEIRQQTLQREEVEEKMFQQFSEQIGELKDMFDLEKKEREQREEEIVQILKAIHQKIAEGLANSKKERVANEEMLVNLIEKVIEKVRKELVDTEVQQIKQLEMSLSKVKSDIYG